MFPILLFTISTDSTIALTFQKIYSDLDNATSTSVAPNSICVNDGAVSPTEIFIPDRSSQAIHRLVLNGSYYGFYLAEGFKAMFANETGIWTAYLSRAVFEPESGESFAVEFESEIQPMDMHYQNESLFILTRDALIKIAIPKR
ncbi:MAG: hypothetical protein MK198_14195 [Gracilimonas sp.]|uniref:hypothetical protein n=1 Tax=Gracilimonas sp. TaxID=1974203 RepID=UPI003753E5F9|nr:hypothetical protein [Gracilimonas sp.]